MKTTIERYIYTGDKLIEDLFNLNQELFRVCKNEQIRLEKRSLRKYGKLTLIPEIDVSQVLFNYNNTTFVLAFCEGIDTKRQDKLYRKYQFAPTDSQYDGIWNELYFHDVSEAPARVGICCDIYSNHPEPFIPEIKRDSNALEFRTDDKGNKLIEGETKSEVIANIDELVK